MKMAIKAKNTAASKQTQQNATGGSNQYDLKKVHDWVSRFKVLMEGFNDKLKPARQSFISVARFLKDASRSLNRKKPPKGKKSEFATFLEAARIDKSYFSRMELIADHADELEQHMDKLPNTESGLYFVARLLRDDKDAATTLLNNPDLGKERQASLVKLKAWAKGEDASQEFPKSHTVALGVESDKTIQTLMGMGKKVGAGVIVRLVFNLSELPNEARGNFITEANKVAPPKKAAEAEVKITPKVSKWVREANSNISGEPHSVPTTE
jgi:hypothetical protein